MGFADTFLVGGALLVAIPIVLGIGARLTRGTPLAWVPMALVVAGVPAAIIGASSWLDRAGAVTTGTVAQKRESITALSAEKYIHHFSVWVQFTPRSAGRPVEAESGVSAATFDSLLVGGPVAVRYLPQHPTFARPAGRTTSQWVRELLPASATGAVLLLAAVIVLAILWHGAHKPGPRRTLAAGGTIALLAVLIYVMIPLRRSPPLAAASQRVADGRVQYVSLERYWVQGRRTRDTWRLAKPYDVVGVRFVPVAARDSVLGADAIDTGSVPGLAAGSVVRIAYTPSDPRDIRLLAGTRTFYDEDNNTLVFTLVALLGLVAAALAVQAASAHVKRRVVSRLSTSSSTAS